MACGTLVVLASLTWSSPIALPSGKKATVTGTGPPILFSAGIFNMVSTRFYSRVLSHLQRRATVVSITDFSPLARQDIDDAADALDCTSVGLFTHSSFDTSILASSRIHRAVLCDPICLPSMSLSGFATREASVDFPVMICRAEYLYDSEITIPEYQTPIIVGGDVRTKTYKDVGHADLLDDAWAKAAKKTKLWVAASKETVPYERWSLQTVKDVDLEAYRRRLATDALNFLFEKPVLDTRA